MHRAGECRSDATQGENRSSETTPGGGWSRDSLTEGVVTAADAAYFLDVQLLVRSLERWGAPRITVFDLGFRAVQRTWLEDRPNVICLEFPSATPAIETIRTWDAWQTWLKPLYLLAVPFERVLWLDADTVVITELDEAFDLLDRTPLLVEDRHGSATQNDAHLYDLLPLPTGVQRGNWGLNAGVVGLCKRRDAKLLRKWADAVEWAASNPNERHLLQWCDQGALVWAIYQVGVELAVRHDQCWNFPAATSPDLVEAAKAHSRTIWEELRARFPARNVLHWYGTPKLSQLLRQEVGDEAIAALLTSELV